MAFAFTTAQRVEKLEYYEAYTEKPGVSEDFMRYEETCRMLERKLTLAMRTLNQKDSRIAALQGELMRAIAEGKGT